MSDDNDRVNISLDGQLSILYLYHIRMQFVTWFKDIVDQRNCLPFKNSFNGLSPNGCLTRDVRQWSVIYGE